MELVIKGVIQQRLQEKELIAEESKEALHITLKDGRIVVFADEPDIAFYHQERIISAVEVKGGIDKAGVLERVGAAMKSLSRAKEENPDSITLLILMGVSMTPQALADLKTNQASVNHWFTVEEMLEDEQKKEEVFNLLNIRTLAST